MPDNIPLVTVERKLKHDGSAYVIVTKKQTLTEDEVTVFSGTNAEEHAYAYAAWMYEFVASRPGTKRNSNNAYD